MSEKNPSKQYHHKELDNNWYIKLINPYKGIYWSTMGQHSVFKTIYHNLQTIRL